MRSKLLYLNIVVLLFFITGCTNKQVTNTTSEITNYVTYSEDDFYTDWKNKSVTTIQFDQFNFEVNGSKKETIITEGNIITLKAAGTYVLQGTFADGQIIVDTADAGTVRLVLNGVSMNSSTSAPIFIKQADKTVISLEEGTENVFTDGFSREEDDLATSVIYSKDDLTINGLGTLKIVANAFDGIAGKDRLLISGGTIDITAKDDGILGRDVLAISDATLVINAKGDGMKSTNEDNEEVGNIVIQTSDVSIESAGDGIASVNNLIIASGTYSITTGGGSPETIENKEEFGGRMPGFGGTSTSTESTEEDSISTKGLKAKTNLKIVDGNIIIDSLDDAIHSNGNVTIEGGKIEILTGDDGIHADFDVVIEDGTINIGKSYEGIEGTNITIKGGHIELIATDDGLNISGGSSNFEPFAPSTTTSTSTKSGLLTIDGGYLLVNANGDGLDSNGNIEMNDGTVIVYGPTNGGNGALDYDGTFNINGGLLIAAGSSGMAMGVSDTSKQNTILMTLPSTAQANTPITLLNSKNEVMLAVTPSKTFQTIVISSPKLKTDESYTLTYDGTISGDSVNGLFENTKAENVTKQVAFTISKIMTYLDSEGITEYQGGFGGFPGGNMEGAPDRNRGNNKEGTSGERPEMPEGFTPPTDGQMPEGFTPPTNGQRPLTEEQQKQTNK